MNILLVSKDNDIITSVSQYARHEDDRIHEAGDTETAEILLRTGAIDVVLLDCSIRPSELIGFAADNSDFLIETVVLLIGPFDPEQREKLGRRLSAQYSIDKPLRGKAFTDVMKRAGMRARIVKKAGLIGRSPAMEEIVQTIMQIGPTPITVLLTGESGSGKEVIARAIHSVSQRADQPFLAINCAALAEGILESELFGHEKGSFTGAGARRIGMFEKANGGTIFLDEIGEVPHSTQVRLLRVLEEREIMRVGGTEIIPVNVRVITATNRKLEEVVESGKFRRDLYYRIKVLEIRVPPLRQRPEDIPLLIDRLARNYAIDNNLPIRRFDDEAKSYLSSSRWTGNVRELRNFVESCLALTSGQLIRLNDIPDHLLGEISRQENLPVLSERTRTDWGERELLYRTLLELKHDISEIKQLLMAQRIYGPVDTGRIMEVVPVETEQTLDDLERQAIIDTLDHTRGNRRKAAEQLGIGERTLYRKLKQYGIT